MISNVGELVRVRQNMKAKIAELKVESDAVEVEMKLIESELLEACKEQNVNTFVTEYGTVSRVVRERYWTSDWEAMHNYILEHGELGLLEQRIQQSNMRAWLDAHKHDHPPGMNISREYTVSIRKPTKKQDTIE